MAIPGSTRDPLARFGQESANHILASIRDVPPQARPAALKALLDSVDKRLIRRVDKASKKLRARGMTADGAVRTAMAMALSQGLLEEYKSLGRGNAWRDQSLAGLATRNGRQIAFAGYHQALGFSIGGAFSKITSPVRGAVSTVTGAIGRGATDAKGKASEWGSKALDAIGDAACSVATSAAGQAGAGLAGGPAAAHGAQVAASMCKGTPRPPAPKFNLVPPPEPGPPKWLLMAAAGSAALAVVLAIR